MGKNVSLIDPGEEVAKELESFLRNKAPGYFKEGKIGILKLFFSDTSNGQEEIAKKWLG